MSLDLTKQRLSSVQDRVNRFIDQNLMIWATEEILLPAQNDIKNSINQRAANALSLDKSGFMKVDLVWELRGDNGEPLHFYLEFGTDPHTITPKGKVFGGADVLKWKGPSGGFVIGKDIFAKRVEHPGSKKHVGMIEQIKKERTPALRERVISETSNRLEIEKI